MDIKKGDCLVGPSCFIQVLDSPKLVKGKELLDVDFISVGVASGIKRYQGIVDASEIGMTFSKISKEEFERVADKVREVQKELLLFCMDVKTLDSQERAQKQKNQLEDAIQIVSSDVCVSMGNKIKLAQEILNKE